MEKEIIIGRKEEKQILEKLYHSNKAEFLAVYGRRRVGKTFLIRNYFKDKGIFFEVTGSFNGSIEEQLDNFYLEYKALFNNDKIEKSPKNWKEAFNMLKNSILKIKKNQKIIIFFDELPWLASPKSDLLSVLSYFWNRHFSSISNVILIIAGSAASWMLSNIINNKGGLYGRLSYHLRLLPFSLMEVEEYLLAYQITLPRKQICELYMLTGGVPKYLSFISPGLSAAQNIHNLCFKPQSPLLTEFTKLYYSLFNNAENHLKIVQALANKRHGLNRFELLKKAKMSSSGYTSKILQELEASGFISSFPEMGKKTRNMHYFLSDEYTLFYFKWIEPNKEAFLQGIEKDHWIKCQSSQSYKSWAGYAFENLCLKHIRQIKEALQIGSVSTKSGYWKALDKGKKEIEIDLIIDRADNCINLCEIKFYKQEFAVTKSYAKELINKKNLFRQRTKSNKALFTTLITPFGSVKNNEYVNSVENQLTLDALFILLWQENPFL